MEIVKQRRKILDAMDSNAKGNDNFIFAIKLISTKDLQGKSSSFKRSVEEVRRKNQTYIFSKVLPWPTSVKVTLSEKLIIFLKL